jgi:hypothetical protein
MKTYLLQAIQKIARLWAPALLQVLIKVSQGMLRTLRSTCLRYPTLGMEHITPVLDDAIGNGCFIQEQLGRCAQCGKLFVKVQESSAHNTALGQEWLELQYNWRPYDLDVHGDLIVGDLILDRETNAFRLRKEPVARDAEQ